ncbi:hypothetical protein [Corynebacterium antarcticum]|uniref:Uncharacterized protein n=1 Tax=Corynebacterium antarcticum TaxID=2800405 RepID=A0A9Q4CAK0_9CORY|nr:hypothetical protein [Corynebacterium antarcticum]MCX7491371.1 hypothetical protein [Corynebacterium antarcticum]MCX7537390.1 hypothetical protein [Corynebacterium antarcticum]MCX7539450.1 hypothetical protein [Corynebacterium antarcticum]
MSVDLAERDALGLRALVVRAAADVGDELREPRDRAEEVIT